LNLSNRVAVYRDGRILRMDSADQFTSQSIMQLLTGAQAV